jgi:hypothetical protein
MDDDNELGESSSRRDQRSPAWRRRAAAAFHYSQGDAPIKKPRVARLDAFKLLFLYGSRLFLPG